MSDEQEETVSWATHKALQDELEVARREIEALHAQLNKQNESNGDEPVVHGWYSAMIADQSHFEVWEDSSGKLVEVTSTGPKNNRGLYADHTPDVKYVGVLKKPVFNMRKI